MKRGAFLLTAVAFVSVLGAFGTGRAADCGNGGSKANHFGSCETSENEVKCGPGNDVGGVVNVSADATGAEVCNSGTTFPLQGRIGVQQSCDCVYIDGDNSNPGAPTPLNSWARIDAKGYHCQNQTERAGQSYNSSDGYTNQGCAGL